MKSVNRKVLVTLFGVVLATPFLVIASLVGIQAVALADNVRIDVFCVALAVASVLAKMVNGHLALTGKTERPEHAYVERKDNTDLRRASTISLGY